MSIRTRLVFVACSVFLVGWLTVVLTMAYLMRDMSQKSGAQALDKAAEALALEVRNTVTDAQRVAGSAADAMVGLYEAGVTDRDTYAELMQQFIGKNKVFAGGGLILEPDSVGADKSNARKGFSNEQGRFAPYFYNDGAKVSWYALKFDRESGYAEWYEKPKALSRGRIGAPYVYPRNGVDTFWATATAPILVSDGAFIGAVTVDFPLNELQALFNGTKLYQTGSTALLDDAGKWVSHRDARLLGKEADPAIRAELSTVTDDVTYSSENGIATAIRPLKLNDLGQKWFVMVAVEEAEFLTESKSIVRISLAIAAGLLLLGAGVMWMYGAAFAKPIEDLAGRIHLLAGGDVKTPVPHMERIDEIGHLASAVDELRQK